jgi:hypothetical protein
MATRKTKPELNVEIPAGSKKLTVKSKPEPEINPAGNTTNTDQEILVQLEELNHNIKKIYDIIYSSDWKQWKMMSMIEMIAKDNGYTFSTNNDDPKEKEI